MNSKNIISDDFKNILSFTDESDELYHESRMIMFRILGEVEKLCENKNMKKKDLAKAIDTSASYITQLFNGSKLLNLETIAKFQKVFNVTFKIEVVPNENVYSGNLQDIYNKEDDGFWVFHNTKKIINDLTTPDYNSIYLSQTKDDNEKCNVA